METWMVVFYILSIVVCFPTMVLANKEASGYVTTFDLIMSFMVSLLPVINFALFVIFAGILFSVSKHNKRLF